MRAPGAALAGIAGAVAILAGAGAARAQRTGSNPAQDDAARCGRLFGEGNLARAEAACLEALGRDGSYVPAWSLYLSVLIAERREERAIAEAERAEERLGVRDPTVLALHGAALFSLAGRPAVDPRTGQPNPWAQKWSRALPLLERAVALDPSLRQAQAPLCTYWLAARDFAYQDRSALACEAALRLDPSDADMLISRAYIALNQNEPDRALTACEAILRRGAKPEMEFKAHACVGQALAEKGDCAGARRTLEPLARYAARGGAVVDLWLLRCADSVAAADRYGREYQRLVPSDARGPLFLAEAYERLASARRPPDLGLYSAALVELDRAERVRGKRPDVARARARLLGLLGRHAEAEAAWKAVYDQAPTNPEAILGYGVAARRAGDVGVALRILEAGVRRLPEDPALRFALGRARVEGGDRAVGLREMEEALAADPRDATRRSELVAVLCAEGVKQSRAGRPADGEALFARAVHHDPTSVLANRDLGVARLAEHRPAEALGPLEVWRSRTGRDRDANLLVGRALAALGRRDEALHAFEQALAAAQRQGAALPVAEVLCELGPLQSVLGRHDDAVAALETARDNVLAALGRQSGPGGAASLLAARALEPLVRRNRALAHLARGRALLASRHGDAAVADLEKAAEEGVLAPRERATASCALALAEIGAGRAAQAAAALESAQRQGGCELRPPWDRLGIDFWMGYARYREATPAGLREALRSFARAQGKAAPGELADRLKLLLVNAQLKLAAEEQARGEGAAAAAAVHAAGRLASGLPDDAAARRELALDRAVIDLAQGRTSEAKRALAELGGRPPEALVDLGIVYEQEGDIGRALQLWQQSGRGGRVREWIDATRRFLGGAAAGAGGQP